MRQILVFDDDGRFIALYGSATAKELRREL